MSKKKNLSVVISGSFRKHLPDIQKKIKEFEDLGINVLSPKPGYAINSKKDFIILSSDDSRDKKNLEQKHLKAIEKAAALYICNIDGYIGSSAGMEFGYALALGKPIYVKEVPTDVTLRLFCSVSTPGEIRIEFTK